LLTAAAAYCTGCGSARPGNGAVLPTEERRPISALFIDMANFTAMSEDIDPEQVRRVQNDYFATVRQVINQYGGVVEKYIGDAVLALFGAPVASETDALRCVRAGLHLHRALAARPLIREAALDFRVGVASGAALVDLSAAHDGGQAIASGEVINTAARLQAIAPRNGVLVCEQTHAATYAEIEYATGEQVTLRGRSRPIQVWMAVTPRQQVRYADDPVPMIGRDRELATLRALLPAADAAPPVRLVFVTGPAGTGKSRLVRELARTTDPSVTWHSASCPGDGDVSWTAVADMVKAEAGIQHSDDALTAADLLHGAVARLAPTGDLDRWLHALDPLVGLPADPAVLSPGEAEAAWRGYLLAAAANPLVLVFEDLHRADAGLIGFIDTLAAQATAAARPMLVVGVLRTPVDVASPHEVVSLTPLGDTEMAALFGRLLPEDLFAGNDLPALVEQAAGNPLYAYEYVRLLVDSDGDGETIPETVQGVLAHRLDLLDVVDRTVLQIAAVVGDRFWPGPIAAALGHEPALVAGALHRLAARDLIEEQPGSTVAGQPEYRFRHTPMRELCYDRIPRAELVTRHQRIGDWLERALDGRPSAGRGVDWRIGDGRVSELGDAVEILAVHRWAAYDLARGLRQSLTPYASAARRALARAARRAYALHSLDAAKSHLDRALALPVESEPLLQLRLELLAATVALQRSPHQPDAEATAATVALPSLADQLYAAGDWDSAAHAWLLRGAAARRAGDRIAALRCADRAVELFDALPARAAQARALLDVADLHLGNFELEPAAAAASAAGDLAELLDLPDVRAAVATENAVIRYLTGAADGFAEVCAVRDAGQYRSAPPEAARLLRQVLIEERGYGDEEPPIRPLDVTTPAPLISPEPPASGGPPGPTAAPDPTATPAPTAVSDPMAELAAARGSGLRRLLRPALARAALAQAEAANHSDAGRLLAELNSELAATSMIALHDWTAPAAHAASLLDTDAATIVQRMLDRTPRATPWVAAASATAAATVAAHQGRRDLAARRYLDAADYYDRLAAPEDWARAAAAALAAANTADSDPRMESLKARFRSTRPNQPARATTRTPAA
jgi:class 3 adenylate cyclase